MTSLLLSALLIATLCFSATDARAVRDSRCVCSTKDRGEGELGLDWRTRDAITCPTLKAGCPRLVDHISAQVDAEALLRMTTAAIWRLGSHDNNDPLNDNDRRIIDSYIPHFHERLPRIPDPIEGVTVRSEQVKALRQARDSIRNMSIVVHKFIIYLEKHSNRLCVLSRYETLRFALVQLYCPVDQLLKTLSDGQDDGISAGGAETSENEDGREWKWNCGNSFKHCHMMETEMLRKLRELENQLALNSEWMRRNSPCA